MHLAFEKTLVRTLTLTLCGMFLLGISQFAEANTLCVDPSGSHGCYSKIQDAVNHAAANDVINVGAGTYNEEVDIGIPLSLIGGGANKTFIDATNLSHSVFVDGYDHPGLNDVTVSNFTLENALYEGVLVANASDVTISDNTIVNNDQIPHQFTGDLTGCTNQPGNGIYETDETGDCGGAIHLVGTINSVVSGNLITSNADGILISDETAESRNNLFIRNTVKDNPQECGIVLASHPNAGNTTPPFAPHFGVDQNTVSENLSTDNGVQVGGSGAGMFSDGSGQGRVSGNVIIGNTLTNNGLGGVALHSHVGPAFGLPADDMSGNQIIGNVIAGNLADQFDTATPGPVGININSGDGGSPVIGTVISQNVISDEAIDIAINTPAEVDIHLNDLRGGKIGVDDVCAFDGATICSGTIDATQDYWGCPSGPGGHGCTTPNGSDVRFTPWLKTPATNGVNNTRGK